MFDSVLVIDDDPIFGENTRALLRQSGSQHVHVIDNVREAVSMLRDGSAVDLLILDLNMPDFDGIEFLSVLVERSFSGALAVVSGETPPVISAARSLAETHGINIIDAVKKPLTKDHIENWFALLNS